MRGVEKDRIRRRLQGGGAPVHVALVPAADIGQNGLVFHRLPPLQDLLVPAAGPPLRGSGDEELYVCVKANQGADVAAGEHRSGRSARKSALERQEGRPDPPTS